MTEKILLGFTVPEGEPFHFEMHHTVITGMTEKSGKTTTAEALMKRHGKKALVFLTKRGEKTFRDAPQIPPYLRISYSWEYVRGMLEASWHERLKFETPWIIRIAKVTKDVYEFRAALTRLLNKEKLRDFDRNVYTVLAAYMDKVLPVLKKAEGIFVDRLELKPGINVMDLRPWYVHENVQMMVIRACMEHILEKENNVVVALPEAWKMLPQSRNTPVKLFFEKFVREGATNGNYLFIDAQDLGGIDKTQLRQVDNWFMGRMKEANEVARILKQTLGVKVKPKTIQTLPLGHFLVASGSTVKTVYVWPAGVPQDIAEKVARKELTPGYVRDNYLKPKKEEDEDLMYKEKWTEAEKKIQRLNDTIKAQEKSKAEIEKPLLAKITELEKEFARQVERLSDLKAEEKVKEATKDLHTELAKVMKRNDDLVLEVEALRPLKKLRDALQEIVGAPGAPGLKPGSQEIGLQVVTTVVDVPEIKKHVTISDDTIRGKILTLAKEGFFKTWRGLSDVVKELEKHRWTPNYDSVKKELPSMARDGLLAKKRTSSRAYHYILAKNVAFK